MMRWHAALVTPVWLPARRAALLPAVLIFLATGISAAPGEPATGLQEIHQRAFQRLEKEVARKRSLLRTTCNFVDAKADSFARDPLVQDFFARTFRRFTLAEQGNLPPGEEGDFLAAQDRFRDHYLDHYTLFYDTMLVGKAGNVFYSVLKNEYVGQNMFSGDLGVTSLAVSMQEAEHTAFVDFQYSRLSEEPAAFFVQPIHIDGRFAGWCILQWAINELNFLFSPGDGLGRTGETVLVNRDHFLITDSRFSKESTSLALKLRHDNIAAKFAEEQGGQLLVDYRGKLVLSRFEVVDFLGSEWLVSAKIDENEVITDHYRSHQRSLQGFLLEPDFFRPARATDVFNGRKRLRVDMGEFVRGAPGNVLFTRGVATCTALVVARPGQFAYLAHLSPYDAAYQGDIPYTDLAAQLVQRLPDYEISRNDFVDVVFYIVANHTDSIETISDTIIRGGFFLSQIHFLRNPEAALADVYYDIGSDTINVVWGMQDGAGSRGVLQTADEQTNLEASLKRFMSARER
jgi:hypothetical protein